MSDYSISIPAHLTEASLVEAAKPNAKGQMVVQVHRKGCQHTNLSRGGRYDVMDTSAEHTYPLPAGWHDGDQHAFGTGIAAAVEYLIAIKCGMMDDGVDEGVWVARLSPCAK